MSRTAMANQHPVGGSNASKSSKPGQQSQSQQEGSSGQKQPSDHVDTRNRGRGGIPYRYQSMGGAGGASLGPDPKPQDSRKR